MKLIIAAIAAATLTGCFIDADMASRNISKAATQFEISRRVVFYDAIQGDYLLSIEGKCSITPEHDKLSVTCKTGPGVYTKHYLGLSDNVTYFAEQLIGAEASTAQYRVIFRPTSLIPNIELDK